MSQAMSKHEFWWSARGSAAPWVIIGPILIGQIIANSVIKRRNYQLFLALTNKLFASKTPWLSDHEISVRILTLNSSFSFASRSWQIFTPSLPNVLFFSRFLMYLSAAWYRIVSPSSSRPSPYKSLNLLSHKSLSLVSHCSSIKLARLECWQRKEFLGLVLDY